MPWRSRRPAVGCCLRVWSCSTSEPELGARLRPMRPSRTDRVFARRGLVPASPLRRGNPFSGRSPGSPGLLVALITLSACSNSPTTALFAVPGAADEEFYDLPFPNDLRRHADGRLDLALLPTNTSLLVDQVRRAAETLDGFGLNSAIFARLDSALDPASLPDPAASITEAASVYLVNVDPDSADRGTRTPIIVTFRVAG